MNKGGTLVPPPPYAAGSTGVIPGAHRR